MKEQKYAKLVMESKTNQNSMLKLLNQMQPLVKSYVKKLFFVENSDAEQELCLSIIEAVRSIKNCETDGQCITYINNAVKYRFAYLCKKNIRKESIEDFYNDDVEEFIYLEKYDDIEIICDWQKKKYRLTEKQKEIFRYLELGYTDTEIANRMQMSRQYINRIKKKICVMLEDLEAP